MCGITLHNNSNINKFPELFYFVLLLYPDIVVDFVNKILTHRTRILGSVFLRKSSKCDFNVERFYIQEPNFLKFLVRQTNKRQTCDLSKITDL